jgi:hypothetical protein
MLGRRALYSELTETSHVSDSSRHRGGCCPGCADDRASLHSRQQMLGNVHDYKEFNFPFVKLPTLCWAPCRQSTYAHSSRPTSS